MGGNSGAASVTLSGSAPRGGRCRRSRAPPRPSPRQPAWSACGTPSPARKAMRLPASGSFTSRSSSVSAIGTASSSVTSCRDRRIWSACSISVWRRLGCLISPARSRSVSRSPYSLIRSAAVFTPIPGAPGMLSTLSPASACTSITRSGPTPNFASTPFGIDADVLHRVEHLDAAAHQLHQVLVRRDDRHPPPGLARLFRQRRDDVVGLVALQLQAGDVERPRRLPRQRDLRAQFLPASRRDWPCRDHRDRCGTCASPCRRPPPHGSAHRPRDP